MVFEEVFEVKQSPRAVFAYASDLTHSAKWDPSVLDAAQTTSGPVGRETRFRVVLHFAGFEYALDYTLTEYRPYSRAVLTGRSPSATVVDVLGVQRAGKGTRLTWRTEIRLQGTLAYLDPLLQVLVRPVIARAARGLGEALQKLEREQPQAARGRRGGLASVETAA